MALERCRTDVVDPCPSVALSVVGPINRAIHTSIRTLSGLAWRPVHFEVRSVESWGCYLQVDLSSVSPVSAVSQSPAFEFPIYTAGNAVAILLSTIKFGRFMTCFCFFPSCASGFRLFVFVYRSFDHAAFVASAMLLLFRSGS